MSATLTKSTTVLKKDMRAALARLSDSQLKRLLHHMKMKTRIHRMNYTYTDYSVSPQQYAFCPAVLACNLAPQRKVRSGEHCAKTWESAFMLLSTTSGYDAALRQLTDKQIYDCVKQIAKKREIV
jgi:hypothetical protein